jgi:hypothetical protein
MITSIIIEGCNCYVLNITTIDFIAFYIYIKLLDCISEFKKQSINLLHIFLLEQIMSQRIEEHSSTDHARLEGVTFLVSSFHHLTNPSHLWH